MININWLPEPIILSINNYLNDENKLSFTSTSKKYHMLITKLFFYTCLPLVKLVKISYRDRFKSVKVSVEEIECLKSIKNISNISSITILCDGYKKFKFAHMNTIAELNIHELIFDTTQPNLIYEIKYRIPETVKILKFCGRIKYDLNILPSGLEILDLGLYAPTNNFNMSLPEKITHLNNYNFYKFAIPKSIISLTLTVSKLKNELTSFDCITHLNLEVFDEIMPNTIPRTVKYLTLCCDYDHEILSDVIPPNLTYLNLRNSSFLKICGRPINAELIPKNLTVLKCCIRYKHSPAFIYELTNLTCLKFYGSEENKLDFAKISDSITKLSTNIYSNTSKIKSSVTNLSIRSYIDNDTLNYLPNNLKKLKIIIRKKNNQNITKYVPPIVTYLLLKYNIARSDNDISTFVKNIPETVYTLKIINATILIPLPEHITNLKIRYCHINNLLFLHDKVVRLTVLENIKDCITDEIRSRTRIKYYKKLNYY